MKQSEKREFTEVKKDNTPCIGVFSVAYHKYWDQFPGVWEELHLKQAEFIRKLTQHDVKIIEFPLIDTPAKAYEVVKLMQAANLDLLFCDMVSYASSGSFGIIIKTINIPIVLVALQPTPGMDCTKASIVMQILNDDICAMPEFVGVAIRMGKKVPEMIIGMLYDDPEADKEIEEFCRIAKVLHGLKNAHFGHIGHPMNSMLDMHSDPTMLTAHFGCHIVQCEANQLNAFYGKVTEAEIAASEKQILEFFDTPDPVSDPICMKLTKEDLRVASKVSVALKNFVKALKIDGLAYYYEGSPGSTEEELMANLIVGNSLLTAEHIPMCGESDLKTLIALFIFDRLGIGGSFAELHPIDFREGFIFVGHDGPHNVTIAEGKPVLRSLKLFHGKPGFGAGVEFKIKEGPITIMSINSTAEGKMKFIIAEGESVRGPIPPTGNTNTRGFFKPDIRTFLKRWISEGPTHHFALGIGHHASSLAKIARYLDVEYKIVDSN